MKKTMLLLLAGALSVGTAGTLGSVAVAQDRDDRPYDQDRDRDRHESGAYRQGYQDGSHSGQDDAARGRRFMPYEHGAYRDSHDESYRDGYLRGYKDAFGNGDYRGRDRNDHDRDDRDRDDDRR